MSSTAAMPALVSSPGLFISSAPSFPCSRHNWLDSLAPVHSRHDSITGHESASNLRTSPHQHARGLSYGISFSSTSFQVRHGRRFCEISDVKGSGFLSILHVIARRLGTYSEDEDEQKVVTPLKRFQYLGLKECGIHMNTTQQRAVVMDRRSFFSLFTSNLASLLFLGAISEMPAIAVPEKTKGKKSPFDEKRLLEQNKRMQKLNNAPADFPTFVREGFNVKVVTTDKYVKCDSGLLYLEIEEGQGDYPGDGQQITFHYIGYNESGRRVDSSYQQGRPARSRLGIKAMIPGFEEGIRTMKPGGKRRIVIPPELGPPVGPSTFFSAKQFEVFDVELLDAKDCNRRTIGFYSDVVCD